MEAVGTVVFWALVILAAVCAYGIAIKFWPGEQPGERAINAAIAWLEARWKRKPPD